MKVVRTGSLQIRMNDAMAELLEGTDFSATPELDWLGELLEPEWAGDLWLLLASGWVRHPSDALLLERASAQPADRYSSLTEYEHVANKVYLPRSGMDLAAPDAFATLAARGHSLLWNLVARIGKVPDRATVVGHFNVHIGPDDEPNGSLSVHEQHQGEPEYWISIDVDKFREEALLVMIAEPGFSTIPAKLPPHETLYPGVPVVPVSEVGESERIRLVILADRVRSALREAGLPVTDGEHAGAHVWTHTLDDRAGVFVRWHISREWDEHVQALCQSGDVINPEVLRSHEVEDSMREAIKGILAASGMSAEAVEGRSSELEIQ